MRLSLILPAVAAAAKVGPIEKVINMLGEMKEEAIKAQNEADKYNASNMARLTNAITESGEDETEAAAAMEAAIAASQDASAQIEVHTQAINDATAEIAAQEDNLKALAKQRQAAKEAYTKNVEDAQTGIVACERLIDALDDISDKTTFFFQKTLSTIKGKKNAIQSLLQAVARLTQPSVVYKKDDKFKAIVDMIENLKTELDDDLTKLNTEEANEVSAYQMAVQNAKNTIKNQTNEKEENQNGKGNQEEKKASADATTDTEKETRDASAKLKQELTSEKAQAEREYAQANQARTSEIQAIGQAVEILSQNQAAAGGAGFIQLRTQNDSKSHAVEFLRKKASSLHSKVLLMLTEVATQDPFAKVKGLIEDLISKLQKEAAAAQSKHDKCVEDMDANKTAIEQSQKDIDNYTNKAAQEKATVDETTINIEKATAAIAQVQENRANGEANNQQRNEELDEQIATGKATHEALLQAIEVLKGGETAGQAGGAGFSGTGGLGQIISFLENVGENQNQANRDAAEEKDNMNESWKKEKEDMAKLEKAEKNKKRVNTEAKAQAEENLITHKNALSAEETNMSGLQEDKRAIDKVCVAKGASHEENKQKREEEIKSLEEALEILANSS